MKMFVAHALTGDDVRSDRNPEWDSGSRRRPGPESWQTREPDEFYIIDKSNRNILEIN